MKLIEMTDEQVARRKRDAEDRDSRAWVQPPAAQGFVTMEVSTLQRLLSAAYYRGAETGQQTNNLGWLAQRAQDYAAVIARDVASKI